MIRLLVVSALALGACGSDSGSDSGSHSGFDAPAASDSGPGSDVPRHDAAAIGDVGPGDATAPDAAITDVGHDAPPDDRPGLGTTRYVGSMPALNMVLKDASGNVVCRVRDNPTPTARPIATDCPDGLFVEQLFDGRGGQVGIDRPVHINAMFTRYEDTPSADLQLVDLTTEVEIFDSGPADREGAPGDANFRVSCQFSHFSYDDPIVYPGEPGRAHLHMFWGNTRTDAFTTTTESLINAGGGTCNGFELNRSAYWTPALLDGDGNALIPAQIIIYYKTKNLNEPGITEVQPMPQGLRLIAGTTPASGPFTLPPSHEEQRLFWSCGRSGDVRVRSDHVPECEADEQVNATIYFPQCWNGVDLDSPNHRDHVARVNVGDPCPASHPVRIPELGFLLYYEHTGDTSQWHLASDGAHGADRVSGGSLHADWIAGWADEAMDLWIDGCIRTGRNCTLGQTGTARTFERLNGTASDDWPGPYTVTQPEPYP